MATRSGKSLGKRFVTLSGSAATDLYCIGARIRDRLSTIPEARMEFFSTNLDFDPTAILGKGITMETEAGFRFSGLVVSVEELGYSENDLLYVAEIRPTPWLLTMGANNRVYQGKSTVEIVKDVLQKAGFTGISDKTKSTYPKREYCVQYGESNFSFISRLMEEDGIYYYFDHAGQTEQIVLCDGVGAHTDIGQVSYNTSNVMGGGSADEDTIYSWTEMGRVVPGKVSLFDHDPLKPKTDMKVTETLSQGTHMLDKAEVYHAGGRYALPKDGKAQAAKELEGFAAQAARARGLSNHPKLAAGVVFNLDHPERTAASGSFLAVSATHYIRDDIDRDDAAKGRNSFYHPHVERIDFPKDMVFFETDFEALRGSVPFRPRRVTPWPEVPSLLTAIVTGPQGEEIHTDKFGRIKVMFPWDRLGSGKDDTSCWVRAVMPWAGSQYGWQSIPRVGMEVIIQFERGNIDRPYCTGMVYSEENMPPFALPADMDKTGLRTKSTKAGGKDDWSELSFKDKKDAEKVFFQAQKDYEQVVKHDATITIGQESTHEGTLTQTIQKDKIETIKEGNLTLKVEKGNRITTVKTDDTSTVEGKSTTTITGDTALTVKTGNLTEKIQTGNATQEVSTGNIQTTASLGNITIEAKAGKITISALQGIELKVGGSTLTVDMTGVTLKGASVTVDAQAMAEIKGSITMVKGQAMTQVSGGIVMVG